MLRANRLIGLAGPILLAAGCRDALEPVAHDSERPTPSFATGPPSRVFINDFERPGDDMPTGSWYDADGGGIPPGTIHRTPSGYTSPSAYGSGILSAHGSWHARLRDNGCDLTRFATNCTGPFTRWGKPTSMNSEFPEGGYVTEVDIYLDVAWTQTPIPKLDYRFDWSSAINNAAGNHQRDFVFNVGTDLTGLQPGFFINASTNATRSGAFPQNPCPNPSTPPNTCRTPAHITTSGWYTFRHHFYSMPFMGTDYLAVDLSIHQHDAVVASWTISVVPVDLMTLIGGDRYGWFAINEINDLAIDCSTLRPPGLSHPPLRVPCARGLPSGGQVTGGGQIPVSGGTGSFGFSANEARQRGHLNYKNHVTGRHVNCSVSVVMILSPTKAHLEGTSCSPNSDASSFTADVEDNANPGKGADKFTITYVTTSGTFTDGAAQTLRSGNIQIH